MTDLPGHSTVETAAAPFAPTPPEDEWLARDLPKIERGHGRSRSLRAYAREAGSFAPTTPNCGYLMIDVPLPAVTRHREPQSHGRLADHRRVDHLQPWQCVGDDCPRQGCNAETCACPPCGCPACDARRKRAQFGRDEGLRLVKPERREPVQQPLFIVPDDAA